MASIGFVLAGVGLMVLGLVLLAVQLRRRVSRSPLRGADRETRHAVRRAIRTGEADDPRIAALTREVALSWPRVRWAPWGFGLLLAFEVFLVVVHIVDRDADGWLNVAVIAYLVFLWVVYQRHQRRLDRFRVSAESSSGSHPSS